MQEEQKVFLISSTRKGGIVYLILHEVFLLNFTVSPVVREHIASEPCFARILFEYQDKIVSA